MRPSYIVRRQAPPRPRDAAGWEKLAPLTIDHFRPESSSCRPATVLRLCHDEDAIHGRFDVTAEPVRAVHTAFQSPVYQDSCVELFLQPLGANGYLNVEFNAIGTLLASHVLDHRRHPSGDLYQRVLLDRRQGEAINVSSSLHAPLPDKLVCSWWLAFSLPFALLAQVAGAQPPRSGERWRANAYKCAEKSCGPHWAAWSPVNALNFHLPECFGELLFG